MFKESFKIYFPLLLLATVLMVFSWSWAGLAVSYFAIVAVADAYVHRLVCHGSYKLNPFVEKIHAVLSCIWGAGTPAFWAAGHKPHHLHADQEGDPFIWRGSFRQFAKECAASKVDKSEYKRLVQSNKIFSIAGKYYGLIQVAVISTLWFIGGVDSVVTFWAMPFFTTYFMTITSGVAAHWKQRPMTSIWSWLWTGTTTGFHEEHHQNPRDYNSGAKGKWAWADIPARYIDLLCWLRLARIK